MSIFELIFIIKLNYDNNFNVHPVFLHIEVVEPFPSTIKYREIVIVIISTRQVCSNVKNKCSLKKYDS